MAERIDNLWETLVVPNILEQYSKITLSSAEIEELGCDNRWQAVIKATVDKLQNVENGVFALSHYFDIPSDYDPEQITSERLEYLASLKNVFRESGETDEDLFERFIESLHTKDAGTPPNVIRTARLLSGDTRPRYMDEAPATFYVYTPRGRQLYRSQVRNMAPAGVLGFPAAALTTATGKHIVTSGGKTFLCVAQDANSSPVSLSSAFAWATVNTEET